MLIYNEACSKLLKLSSRVRIFFLVVKVFPSLQLKIACFGLPVCILGSSKVLQLFEFTRHVAALRLSLIATQ